MSCIFRNRLLFVFVRFYSLINPVSLLRAGILPFLLISNRLMNSPYKLPFSSIQKNASLKQLFIPPIPGHNSIKLRVIFISEKFVCPHHPPCPLLPQAQGKKGKKKKPSACAHALGQEGTAAFLEKFFRIDIFP
jgi:hypothetical protein